MSKRQKLAIVVAAVTLAAMLAALVALTRLMLLMARLLTSLLAAASGLLGLLAGFLATALLLVAIRVLRILSHAKSPGDVPRVGTLVDMFRSVRDSDRLRHHGTQYHLHRSCSGNMPSDTVVRLSTTYSLPPDPGID